MRLFTRAAAALALDVHPRRLENFLARYHPAEEAGRRRQGVTRLLAEPHIVRVALALTLNRSLSVPLREAALAADRLCKSGGTGTVEITPEVFLTIDLSAFEQRVQQRLTMAAESAAMPRRGRPPRHGSRRDR